MTRTPFFYATGFKTRADALDDIDQMFSEGEIDQADAPRVRGYKAQNGKRRYAVELMR